MLPGKSSSDPHDMEKFVQYCITGNSLTGGEPPIVVPHQNNHLSKRQTEQLQHAPGDYGNLDSSNQGVFQTEEELA